MSQDDTSAELFNKINETVHDNFGHYINTLEKPIMQLITSYTKEQNRLARIDELKRLKEEYHNNIVSDDRMDLEIDERLAELKGDHAK